MIARPQAGFASKVVDISSVRPRYTLLTSFLLVFWHWLTAKIAWRNHKTPCIRWNAPCIRVILKRKMDASEWAATHAKAIGSVSWTLFLYCGYAAKDIAAKGQSKKTRICLRKCHEAKSGIAKLIIGLVSVPEFNFTCMIMCFWKVFCRFLVTEDTLNPFSWMIVRLELIENVKIAEKLYIEKAVPNTKIGRAFS